MKLLFEIDLKDYDPADVAAGRFFSRPSARAIIFRDGKIALIYSRKFDFCKIPGGGVEPGEDNVTAMIRETKEESGLVVKRETVKEFGYVHRIQKGDHEPVFIQDNFYYTCEAEDKIESTEYTQKEKDFEFEPCFMPLEEAIRINRHYVETCAPDDKGKTMIERELKVLELVAESTI